MTIGIYKIINKINGHMYIGQSVNIERRFKEHQMGRNVDSQVIDKAILKYGKNNFVYEIIEEFDKDILDLDNILNDKEKHWIKFYNTYENKSHYNLTPGGDFCPAKIPEIAEKISKALSGRKLSDKHKQKISENNWMHNRTGKNNPNYGKKHSKETRMKLSKLKSGKNNPMYGRTGKNNPNYGKKLSEETKRKISKANSRENHYMYGKKVPEETKRKISETSTKNYARIIKDGYKNKKQNYAIVKNGKKIKYSISKAKLKKWFKEQYPNEELVDNTIND